MDDSGVYLYCFARPEAARSVEASGVDERWPVETLEGAGVAAVISAVALADFSGPAAEANLQDPAWLLPRACRHEQVIEEVMRAAPVLPVRFGAVFSSRESLARLLEQHGSEIAAFLDDVAGREEWEIKGIVKPEEASGWLLEADAGLARRYQALATAPGARYFQEKKLRADAEQQALRWARSVLAEVGDRLRDLGYPLRSLKPRPRDAGRKAPEVLQRWAILVDRARLDVLRDFCAAIDRDHAGRGLALEQSGPWPPYHFCPALEEVHG